jgi:cytochrome c553
MRNAPSIVAAAKLSCLAMLGVATAVMPGCANPSRSRDVSNPQVEATTLARQVCSNCHGISGNSVSPNFPNLAAQTPEYLVAQLKGFRSHDRRDPAGFEYMWGLSRKLTDQQIEGLASYYAGQTLAPSQAAAPSQMLAAGKAVFEEGVPAKNVPACTSCHGASGMGNGSFPRIAGQHADYVVKQLMVFQRTHERAGGLAMEAVAHDLSRDDIESVATYVQSMGRL